jgi:DNA-binding winged helix-turn-helix (wHTH) protein
MFPNLRPDGNADDPHVRTLSSRPGRRDLFRGEEPIPLGRRAVSLLRVLVERPGVPISKESLIEVGMVKLGLQ